MAFEKQFEVRWSDCDANGHLRNTVYSEYCIETRMSFLASNGYPHEWFSSRGFGPVILREELDYLHEVHLGETVVVDFSALGLAPDGARFRVAHNLRRQGGKPVARVVLLGGWLDLERRRLTPPPEELRRLLESVPRGEPFAEIPPLKPR
ncbi:MAG TPA: acyl-CoA thioesterase [Anaeromyxobacter sp.]|nr:acyl-CoA thioesterase [Anaeromyxobacter sp.]